MYLKLSFSTRINAMHVGKDTVISIGHSGFEI